MLRKKIIRECNKRLFESRLQIKPKSGIRRPQISSEYKRYSNNQSMLNNSGAYFQKQQKNNSFLENSFLSNKNNLNNSINKNIIKRNEKNRQNCNLNTSQNKSNILIKDITFFI
jgi:hypothetical protein